DNFFDRDLIASIADAYEALDADPGCRAIVLCSEGKHFCAGASLGRETAPEAPARSEEHTSELQSRFDLVCRLLLEKKKKHKINRSASNTNYSTSATPNP